MKTLAPAILLLALVAAVQSFAQPKSGIAFSPSAAEVATWGIFKISVTSENALAGNPFTDAAVSGKTRISSPTGRSNGRATPAHAEQCKKNILLNDWHVNDEP
jgi:hypothetical protein